MKKTLIFFGPIFFFFGPISIGIFEIKLGLVPKNPSSFHREFLENKMGCDLSRSIEDMPTLEEKRFSFFHSLNYSVTFRDEDGSKSWPALPAEMPKWFRYSTNSANFCGYALPGHKVKDDEEYWKFARKLNQVANLGLGFKKMESS